MNGWRNETKMGKGITSILRNKRIKDGTPASVEDIPWAVVMRTIRNGEEKMCGGIIVAEDLVLTAAHCLLRHGHTAEDVVIVAGRPEAAQHLEDDDWLDEHGVAAHKFWIHDGYSDTSENGAYTHDIAVVKLTRPLNLGDASTRKICLPDVDEDIQFRESLQSNNPIRENHCRAAGWSIGDEEDDRLKFIDVRISGFDKGSNKIFSNMTSLGVPYPTCRGDSGGPVFCQRGDGRPVLVGVLSQISPAGYKCESSDVKIRLLSMTRVSHYLNWIKEMYRIAHPEKYPTIHDCNNGRCVTSGVVCQEGCCVSAEPILSFNWIREGVKTISRRTEYDDEDMGTPTAIVDSIQRGAYVSMKCHPHLSLHKPETNRKRNAASHQPRSKKGGRRGGKRKERGCGTARYHFYHRPSLYSDLYLVSAQHTDVFFIHYVRRRHSGDYFCTVHNDVTGYRSRMSPVLRLYVQASCGPPPPLQPYNSDGVSTPDSAGTRYSWVLWKYWPAPPGAHPGSVSHDGSEAVAA